MDCKTVAPLLRSLLLGRSFGPLSQFEATFCVGILQNGSVRRRNVCASRSEYTTNELRGMVLGLVLAVQLWLMIRFRATMAYCSWSTEIE